MNAPAQRATRLAGLSVLVRKHNIYSISDTFYRGRLVKSENVCSDTLMMAQLRSYFGQQMRIEIKNIFVL